MAEEYKQNAHLVPPTQSCSIPHQKSLSSSLSLRVETFKATRNKKAGEPISYKTNNNVQ